MYGMTDFTRELADTHLPALYTYLMDISYPTASHFSGYIAKQQYKNPTDFDTCNLNDLLGPGKSIWTLNAERPEFATAYRNMLTYYGNAKPSWTDIYPTESIIDKARLDHPLLVDVAGGIGSDLKRFLTKHPEVPAGSLVLEELPKVLERAELPSTIQAQPFDLMKAQPVHGARVYYMHVVLHDWPDHDAVTILQNIVPAMERGYSKILIHEVVVASKDAHPFATASDLHMMLVVSGLERSESRWKEVIEKAGLRLTKIWSNPDGGESILEVEMH